MTTRIQPVIPLPGEVVQRVWADLPLLRDGDPNAKPITMRDRLRRGAWSRVFDFREARPDSYLAVLLALSVGLRANEIDKARWSWFSFDGEGNCILEVREEADFKPKGGMQRQLKIPRKLYDALIAARSAPESVYVLGGDSDPADRVRTSYRCDLALRRANSWLAERGIEDGKGRRNSLHRPGSGKSSQNRHRAWVVIHRKPSFCSY
jgi:integrase